MQGFPYEYNGALPRLLKDRLSAQFSKINFEVINLGITAVNSYAIVDIIKEVVNYSPDLIIVYLGHNEFYGTFGVGSTEYIGKNRIFVNLYLELNHYKVFQLVRKIISYIKSFGGENEPKAYQGTVLELMAREKEIPFQSPLYEVAKVNFRDNLFDIIKIAQSKKIPIMLSTVVGNLRDQPPFISKFSSTITSYQETVWTSLVTEGKKLDKEDKITDALEKFNQAYKIDSSRADINYLIANCLLKSRRSTEAKHYYEVARDYDLLRFRASGEFNDIIRFIAQENNIMLADIEKIFEHLSPDFIVDNSLMLEHVHPNLNGYFIIAKEFANIIKENNPIFQKDQWTIQPPDEQLMIQAMMTAFDFEVSILRMDNLLHHWPFSEPESTRYKPITHEGILANAYMNKIITWDQAHYELAEYYKQNQKFVDAEREYFAIAKVLWFDYQPFMLAGDLYLTLRNNDAAMKCYKDALDRSNNQFTQVRLGAVNLELEKPEIAAYHFEQALYLDSRAKSKFKIDWKLQVMYNLSIAYLKMGDTTRVYSILKNVLAIDPSNKQAQELLTKLTRHGI